MPWINGAFYGYDEVRAIHQWYEREVWQEDVKKALTSITQDCDRELGRYISVNWNRLVRELAQDIPKHLKSIRAHAAKKRLSLRNLIEESVHERCEKGDNPEISEFLQEKISIISSEDASLLIDGTLPLERRNNTGLYLELGENGTYVALDYSNQARWIRDYGIPDDPSIMPEGWVEEFKSPLEAVGWLLGEPLDRSERR